MWTVNKNGLLYEVLAASSNSPLRRFNVLRSLGTVHSFSALFFTHCSKGIKATPVLCQCRDGSAVYAVEKD